MDVALSGFFRDVASGIGKAWFNTLLATDLLVVNSIIVPASLVLSAEDLGKTTRRTFAASTRVLDALMPHVRVKKHAASLDWSAVGRSGRPVMLLINHTSLFDFSALCLLVPWDLLVDARVVVSSKLLKIPLFGSVSKHGEAIPVFFKAHEDGVPSAMQNQADFSVARERAHETTDAMAAHLARGGTLALFPEGNINRAPSKLLPFRRGAFQLAHQHDVELWGLALDGCDTVWPVDEAVGGAPADVTGRLFAIAPEGARALAADVLRGATGEANNVGAALADHSRAAFQQVLDEGPNGGS